MSINPFAIDLSQATPILALCGSLAGSVLLGLLIFTKIDATERAAILKERKKQWKAVKTVVDPLVKSTLIEQSLSEKYKLHDVDSIAGGGDGTLSSLLAIKTASAGSIRAKPNLDTPATARRGFPSRSNLQLSVKSDLGRSGKSIASSKQSAKIYLEFDESQKFGNSQKLGAIGESEKSEVDSMLDRKEFVREEDVEEETALPVRATHTDLAEVTNKFVDGVLGDDSVSFGEHYSGDRHLDVFDCFSWNAMNILLSNHYMTHFYFADAGLNKSRLIRWLETCRCILINVFLYTLFFSVQYPPLSACSIYQDKISCLTPPSKFTSGASLCKWSASAGCSVTPPPSSLTFSLMVTLVMYIIGIPIDIMIGRVQEEYGMKIPDFGKYNLGGCMDFLNRVFCCGGVWGIAHNDKHYKIPMGAPHVLPLPDHRQGQNGLSPRGVSTPDEVDDPLDASRRRSPEGPDSLSVVLPDEEANAMSIRVYEDRLNPREELQAIMQQAQRSVFAELYTCNVTLGTLMRTDKVATFKAVKHYLNMHTDGTLGSLTMWQRLWYRNREDMLERKLGKARKAAMDVIEDMAGFDERKGGMRDVALMQHFMVENVHWVCRASLRANMFSFDTMPEQVDPVVWILAWCVVGGSILFFLVITPSPNLPSPPITSPPPLTTIASHCTPKFIFIIRTPTNLTTHSLF